MSKQRVGIIGGGNMGEAILKSICRKYSVSVCETSAPRRRSLKKKYRVKCEDLKSLAKSSKTLILAVKPQDIDSVLSKLKSLIKKDTLVISIAAGITCKFIEKKLGGKTRVIRTMPNMPAQVSEGITALSKGRHASSVDVKKAARIFNEVGTTIVVSENQFDAITAVSGSGPAYVFLFAEAMMNAAQSLGLSKTQSKELVYQTIKGSSSLLFQSNDDAETLRQKVTSKGGTTFAALQVFKKAKYTGTVKSALRAAKQKAKQLSRS